MALSEHFYVGALPEKNKNLTMNKMIEFFSSDVDCLKVKKSLNTAAVGWKI